MKAIGGYFELELQKGKETFHTVPALKSGRAALHAILKKLRPQNVYIPFYTCDGLLESFAAAAVPYQFYAINHQLEPQELPELKSGEYFLYINYFGLKNKIVERLIEKYGDKLIIDCSQAFFYKGDGQAWSFNSCRKFFGVPDGGYIYYPNGVEIEVPKEKNEAYTIQHLLHRFNGNVKNGYPFFAENEILCNADLKSMSSLSECLLSHINYDECMLRRKENFRFLHQEFKDRNLLKWEETENGVPMVYPLLTEEKVRHEKLWSKNLFVPIFWQDVIKRKIRGFATEEHLTNHLLPLPVDHRYTEEDMQEIVSLVNSL